jgi:hypothetical protein
MSEAEHLSQSFKDGVQLILDAVGQFDTVFGNPTPDFKDVALASGETR